MLLAELTTSLTTLRGIGPRSAEAYARMGIRAHRDLLLHIPRSYNDRTTIRSLAHFADGEINTIATVIGHAWIRQGRTQVLKVVIRDESATGALICYGRNFLADRLPIDTRIKVAGPFQFRYHEIQTSRFDFVDADNDDSDLFNRILPVYPLSQSLVQQAVRQTLKQVLHLHVTRLDDDIPVTVLHRLHLPPMSQALQTIHFPATMEQIEPARRSLALQELFLLQLGLARRIYSRQRVDRTIPPPTRQLMRACIDALAYPLTADQRRCIDEIAHDLNNNSVTARLLQGDVGCGKTLVAFMSALMWIERGYQVAFMAPTELLVRQHTTNAHALLDRLSIGIGELYGTQGAAERNATLERLADGTLDLIIGTHALFSDTVRFHHLGLVIVDEQQRFGVLQRSALLAKGTNPDLLLITATPIPRTLALTIFGDLSISIIRSMPPGRQAIDTHLTKYGNEQRVYRWVRRELISGRQAYFVYPLIEHSETIDARDAESMYEHMRRELFADFRIGLIHSRIPEDQKHSRMSSFIRGEFDILVATSVVEVGMDIPNATCIVVEHAERFGLAALHQLRGRVGRGPYHSHAFFIYDAQASDIGKRRLQAIYNEHNGFTIAEIDLTLRGAGDLIGTRQAGDIDLRFARLPQDLELLKDARNAAFEIIRHDPRLEAPEHQITRRALEALPKQ